MNVHLPIVSFVIATRNRCDELLRTLAELDCCGLAPGDFAVHVVDNASTDDTPRRVREHFPHVRLTALRRNLGSVAKNIAIEQALGRYVVFLDDDSFPQPGSIERMIEHFDADPKLGAATFTVNLPSGRRECSAYPDVFIGCGVGFRRRVLRLLGGLPDDFFMQAEEYDLSLRLLDAGWRVRAFDDLHVTHLKTPRARIAARTVRLDVRNNLFLILRRFPLRHVLPYTMDWMRRYAWIAHAGGRGGAFWHGLIEGILRSLVRPRRKPISEEAFEEFAKLAQTTQRLMTSLAAATAGEHRGIRVAKIKPSTMPRVLFVDAGKNVYAYWRACRTLGVEIAAIADDKLAAPGRRYRGVPILRDEDARKRAYDMVLIANTSPAHAKTRLDQWKTLEQAGQGRPVIDLFEPAGIPIRPISGGRPAASESHRTVARTA